MAPQKLSDESIRKISDRVASIILSGQVIGDQQVDLVLAGAKAIDEYLTDAFSQTTGVLIDKPTDPDTGEAYIASYMLQEIAKLRSDVFLLKQVALKSIPSSHFTDPLVALSTRMPKAAGDASLGSSTTLSLSDKVLGHVWYVEKQPDGSFWRWMGPLPRGTLVLPTWGPGTYSIEIEVSALKADQIKSLSISANDVKVEIEVTEISENRAYINFIAETTNDFESFIFLALSVNEVISPQDLLLSDDSRKLGIGLSHLKLTRLSRAS